MHLTDDPDYPGVAHCIGPYEVGMFVHKVKRRGDRFEFRVEHRDVGEIQLQGEVRSSRHIADGWAPGCRYELRVSLIAPPPEWGALIRATEGALDQREDERYPIALPVEFIEPPGVGHTMTRNIAEGGAFIEGVSDLAIGTLCVVRLALPAMPERMWAVGRVVRVDETGVGLRFLEMQVEGRLGQTLAEYDEGPIVAIHATTV